MPKRIELPAQIGGEPEAQLRQLYSYLYQMAEALNSNLAEIGGNALTDDEMVIMRDVIGDGNPDSPGMSEGETLKSMIIKTAQFVRSQIDEYNLTLIGTYEAEGKLGKYVRKTRLDVDVTPTGIQQNYTFQDIIQGLKTYEVNAKNYIKTGLLRTVSSVPVYGVAIGKDVVTFSEDGTETYNDGNKVAELTADELSFWQNSVKVASYTGSKISFYNGGSEVMYIQNGKIYCTNDLELASGKKLIITTDNLSIDANGNVVLKGDVEILSGKSLAIKSGGTLSVESGGGIDIHATGELELTGTTVSIKSGSTFDVEATNFQISSQDKKMVSGNWTFSDDGSKYYMGKDNVVGIDLYFQLGGTSFNNDACSGIRTATTDYQSGGQSVARAYKVYLNAARYNKLTQALDTFAAYFGYDFPQNEWGLLPSNSQQNEYSAIGRRDYSSRWNRLYTYDMYGGRIWDNKTYLMNRIYKAGSSTYSTDEIIIPGLFYLNSSYITGLPTGVSGDFEMEVRRGVQDPDDTYHTDDIIQIINTIEAIYMRKKTSTWGSWYKFTGTAV